MKNGFKEETAFSLDEEVRTAFWIILEEQSGRGKYNFEANKFEGDK